MLKELLPPATAKASFALADRIARNREIAGLHFPSDTAAGKTLAEALLPLLRRCDSFKTAMDAARREWHPACAAERSGA